MERESFIFYRSFYDSIKGLGDAEFAECMRFLCEYALNDRELEGGTLEEALSLAAAASALAVSRPGAADAVPGYEEVLRTL